ncbi:hypothetical protein JYU15_01140, partial [bacterium AH-315-I18]|nr:hypothetical protein [bacterium AH-315-I18]
QQSVITDQKLLENQDVIIMGSNVEKMLNASQRQSLAQWVTQGGGLLWLRSSKVRPKLWPKMLVDPHQLQNQSNISQLLAGLSLPIKNQNTQPLLTHWQVGQGHVLKLNDALLNLSVSQNQQMNLLAIRMANWLAKPLETGQGRQAQMHLDRHAALAGQTITITLIVRDNVHPQLQVTESDGTTRTLSVKPDITNPLQWFSDLTLQKPGIYWIDLLSHDIKQAVNVRLADDEAMHLSANHTLLRKIARQTGGQFWLSPKQMIDGLKDSQMQHLAKQSQPVSRPCFNHPILVISIISLWLGSWYLTRRKGGI